MCRSANLEAGLDVGLLARLTPGYVGSDLDALMEAAASIADERQCREAWLPDGYSQIVRSYVFCPWGLKDSLLNLIPSFPWIASPRPPSWHNPRKGRDHILLSGNIASLHWRSSAMEAAASMRESRSDPT